MDNTVIYIAIGFIIMVWMMMKFFNRFYGSKEESAKIKTYPIDRRNKEKEIELLDDLLQDIRNNTQAWTYTGYNMSSMAAASIINDVKNIAIVIGQNAMLRTTTSIAISYGLKDVAEYNKNTPNNVCTHIQGKHVTEFCIKVEDCLDTRGHELNHFKEQIKSKL